MAIKKLQNDFTTPEQSKRLLELGFPADSANLYNVIPTGYIGFCREKTFSEISNEIISVSRTKYRQIYTKDDIIPCWSVGRLIEIFEICYGEKFCRWSYLPTLVDDCIEHIEFFKSPKSLKIFDLSKLEE